MITRKTTTWTTGRNWRWPPRSNLEITDFRFLLLQSNFVRRKIIMVLLQANLSNLFPNSTYMVRKQANKHISYGFSFEIFHLWILNDSQNFNGNQVLQEDVKWERGEFWLVAFNLFLKVRIRARNRRGWSPLSKLLEFETTFQGDNSFDYDFILSR